VDPLDSTLRDFCGRCVQEFVRWSVKQTTPQQQERSPTNIKSLFKRIYSLALHPSSCKRLGAALAFNSIYRQFRSRDALCSSVHFLSTGLRLVLLCLPVQNVPVRKGPTTWLPVLPFAAFLRTAHPNNFTHHCTSLALWQHSHQCSGAPVRKGPIACSFLQNRPSIP